MDNSRYRRPYDLFVVQSATVRSRDFVEIAVLRAERYKLDPRRSQRLEAFQCIYCYYTPMIAGQAFTAYACARCGAEESHPNTAVPALCRKCAMDALLCQNCMSDLEWKKRRKLP